MATLKETDNVEELTIVEEDPSKVEPPVDQDNHDDEDDRLSSNEDENDVNPDDPDNKEREAIRERRRLEKLERKERRDKAITRDKLELDFLRKRNDDLERRMIGVEQRTHQSDLSTYDAHIAKARQEAEMAERVMAKAVEAGNGEDVTQALKYRDQALQRAQQLAYAKQQAAQQQRPAQAPALDDRTAAHAQEFMTENKWYDPQGRNEDSAIVLAIDQGLVRDGFNPQEEEYWEELRKRVARRLPERVKPPAPNARTPRGGPAVGSGREHAPASTRTEVYISPERKQALIEAGVWDDPVLRMKYAKRYAEYDRNKRNNA